MNNMSSIKMAYFSNLNFEYILEQLFLLSGLFLLLAGTTELLIIILSPTYKDMVLEFEMTFIYFYMIILGAFLILYHGRILVKGYRT